MSAQFDKSFPELEPLQPSPSQAASQQPASMDKVFQVMRASRRFEVNSRVKLFRADASRTGEPAWEGATVDISNGGCQILGATPLPCGDYFFMHFSPADIQLGPQLGRTLRIRLLDDSTFEIGFRFEHPVQIEQAIRRQGESPEST